MKITLAKSEQFSAFAQIIMFNSSPEECQNEIVHVTLKYTVALKHIQRYLNQVIGNTLYNKYFCTILAEKVDARARTPTCQL